MEWSEAYRVEIAVDAAIAVEHQIPQEVGTQHWVLESQKITNDFWLLCESRCDIDFATSVGDHLESVVRVLLDP